MQIDVEHIARLARLGLSEEEKKLYEKQLSAILDYADNLKKIKTDNVPPTSHAVPLKNVCREDKAIPCADTAEIVANGPQVEANMFKVPRIVE